MKEGLSASEKEMSCRNKRMEEETRQDAHRTTVERRMLDCDGLPAAEVRTSENRPIDHQLLVINNSKIDPGGLFCGESQRRL
jgi:hypothetical protein